MEHVQRAALEAGLEEIPINYLTYPLDDRKRGPCPGGGYFSTARLSSNIG